MLRIPVLLSARRLWVAALFLSASFYIAAPCLLAQTDPAAADRSAGTTGADPQAQSIPQNPAPRPHEELRDYVGKFLIYAGYATLDTPSLNLVEHGVHLQAGMRWSRHISLGLDYSRSTGNNSIGLAQATKSLQDMVNPLIANLKATGILPQNYVAALPLSSRTQTFTGGPEFPWRRFNRITPYIRPSVGLLFESAQALPNDFLTKTLVKEIAPSGGESQTTLFYGVGGGCAFNVTRHFSLVVQADFVHYHLFPDLLASGSNAVRISVGPGVQFGKNVTRRWGMPGRWD